MEWGGLPLGFNSREEFAEFGRSARTALNEAGFPESEVYMRGSAVTGYSYRTGEAFDAGRRSDYDIAIVSPRLLERAKTAGVPLRSGGVRTRELTPGDMRRLGLEGIAVPLGRSTRREVTIMVHGSRENVEVRGPFAPID